MMTIAVSNHCDSIRFSLGGSQLQDFMVRFNEEHRYFAAGIKVDGVCHWSQLVRFGIRQNLISKVLGEVVHSSYLRSLFAIDGTITSPSSPVTVDVEKVKAMQRRMESEGVYGFDFEDIVSRKSAECLIIEVVEMMMAPAVGMSDPVKYLQSVGPSDMQRINVPMLVFNSWNDSFQDPADLPIGIANANPNVIHLVTRLGAHCVRREGILGRNCWQSKVSLEFANAVVHGIGKCM